MFGSRGLWSFVCWQVGYLLLFIDASDTLIYLIRSGLGHRQYVNLKEYHINCGLICSHPPSSTQISNHSTAYILFSLFLPICSVTQYNSHVIYCYTSLCYCDTICCTTTGCFKQLMLDLLDLASSCDFHGRHGTSVFLAYFGRFYTLHHVSLLFWYWVLYN